jgi:glyoxylase-like metal-dependent hydrolase (beta-lactamase superfamily II)
VRLNGYQVLCTGDTIYTLRHLAVDQVRPVAVSRKAWARQADSIRRIQRLRQVLPDTVIAPAHDHTRYASAFLEPFLADGGLSVDEREAIRAYERRVFTSEWELAPRRPAPVRAAQRSPTRGQGDRAVGGAEQVAKEWTSHAMVRETSPVTLAVT